METFMSDLTVGLAAPKLKIQGLCFFRRLHAVLLIEIPHSCSPWQEYLNASITDKPQIKSDINQRLHFFSFLLIWKSYNNRINSAREKSVLLKKMHIKTTGDVSAKGSAHITLFYPIISPTFLHWVN